MHKNSICDGDSVLNGVCVSYCNVHEQSHDLPLVYGTSFIGPHLVSMVLLKVHYLR